MLEAADVLAVAAALAGAGPDPAATADLVLLEYALGRVRQAAPHDPPAAAALVCLELTRSRPFAVANREVAWLAACQLLSLNGVDLPPGDAVLAAIVSGVADRGGCDALADWIRSHARGTGGTRAREAVLYERFSDPARQVLGLARDAAGELGHDFIGTEHLLIGLVTQDPRPGTVALRQAGITAEAVRDAVAELIGPSSDAPAGSALAEPGGPGGPQFTPRTKKVLELSLREAMAMKSWRIEPGHVLLGMVREGGGVAVKVLEDLGVDLKHLRREVLRTMRVGLAATTPPEGALRSIDLRAYRRRMMGDLDALTTRIRSLEAECERLRGLLRQHGVEPDGGERSA